MGRKEQQRAVVDRAGRRGESASFYLPGSERSKSNF